ncbi:MAG: TonB-dependent receptor, partial [Alistipes sp.]|nr:TonB-dependent receptor [Alistipes sp.]
MNDYYPFRDEYVGEETDGEPRAMLETDSSLFYRAVQSAGDLFGEATDYKFSFVAYGRRGEPYRADALQLDGFRVSVRYAALLRALYAERRDAVATPWGVSGIFGRSFAGCGEDEAPRRDASVRFSGRGDLAGVRFSATERLRDGWLLTAALLGATGRDLHVSGVFGNSLQLGMRLSATFGGHHECSLLAMLPLTMRGRRAYTTREAFELTGDPMYNPAWGYQSGKERNARIRRETTPLLLLAWRFALSSETSLRAVLACDGGVVRRSALGWYGVSSPLPDHYASMPSACFDGGVLEERWRVRDPRYTQIDWDRIYAANRSLSGSSAAYVVEDRAERFLDLRLRVEGETRIDDRLTVCYGVEAERIRARHYKQLRDLLGGDYLTDRDPYLYWYGTNDDRNDLRHPDRAIREGDRFGYDYDMCGREISVGASLEYRVDRMRLQCAGRIGESAFYRRGRYEKAIFPGEGSCGRSRTMRFAPFRVRVAAGCSFSPRDYLEAVCEASSERPDGDDLLLNPEYNNRSIDRPTAEKRYAAEVGYLRTGSSVRLRVSLFAVRTSDGVDVCRYYDDPAGMFCDMVVSRIGTLRYGAEAAAVVRLARRWELTLAGSVGRYRYACDPRVTIYADRDNGL